MTVFLISLLCIKILEVNQIKGSKFWVSLNESEAIMAIQRHGYEKPAMGILHKRHVLEDRIFFTQQQNFLPNTSPLITHEGLLSERDAVLMV